MLIDEVKHFPWQLIKCCLLKEFFNNTGSRWNNYPERIKIKIHEIEKDTRLRFRLNCLNYKFDSK